MVNLLIIVNDCREKLYMKLLAFSLNFELKFGVRIQTVACAFSTLGKCALELKVEFCKWKTKPQTESSLYTHLLGSIGFRLSSYVALESIQRWVFALAHNWTKCDTPLCGTTLVSAFNHSIRFSRFDTNSFAKKPINIPIYQYSFYSSASIESQNKCVLNM